ncbi:hypothetical protein DL93DRAFT_2075106 [Clavulina sp. PMI_390]|nr:hypothetical protein DL93DRAFT_2075106 [Clavulina sp. PMI_390]
MASPYPHYVWAVGHFLALVSSLWYFKAYITFRSSSNAFYYRSAFTGAITSYAIVCYKSLGTPQPNAAYVQRALADENVQYFIMALIWWFSKPVPLALVPYTIFSLFHALTFTRTTILPLIFKPAPAAPRANGQAAPPAQSGLAKTIGVWVKSNYDTAMVVVARLELLILLRTTLGVITFQNSLIIPIVYAHFLRARYFYSSFTRDAVDTVTKLVDGYAAKAGTHPMVGNVWAKVKMAAGRWAGGVLQPAAPAGAAPAAN